MSSPPPPPAASSSARLVLLPDTDERDLLQDYVADDDDDEAEDQRGIDQPVVVPLPPSVIFLHLLSPYLRLGVIYASDVPNASLTSGLAGLLVAASLSAFCRQIWFLLGRYLRKSSTEDVLVRVFAPRRRGFRRLGLARYACVAVSGLFRILLAAMYLRDSVDSAVRLKVEWIPSLSRANIATVLSILVFVFSLPRHLGSKTLVYATSFSVASYAAWLVATFSAANHPSLPSFPRGSLWNEISSLVFACTTAMTLPLSASLSAGTPSCTPASRSKTTRSFEWLNLFSTVLATLLIVPVVVMASTPRAPATKAMPSNLVLALRAATLVLSIPSVVVSITMLPLHGAAYRFIRSDLALAAVTLAVLGLSLVPPDFTGVLDDVMLSAAISGSFFLPALAHVAVHYLRRPLSIVVPQERSRSSALPSPRPSHSDRSSLSPSRDPLLQRKERLLQRRRFGQRLLWDVLVWVVLVPACVYALVWAGGRLAGRW